METQTETTATTTTPFVEPLIEKTIHPSKKVPDNFYWRVSVKFAPDEKPVEKFSKLFVGEAATQADMDLNADAKVQEIIAKRNKAA